MPTHRRKRSGGSTTPSRRSTVAEYTRIYESKILPQLEDLLDELIGGDDWAVTLSLGRDEERYVLRITTPAPLDERAKTMVRELVERESAEAMAQTARLDVKFQVSSQVVEWL